MSYKIKIQNQVCLTWAIALYFCSHHRACKILVPQPGIKPMPCPLQWKSGILTTGPPGKSPESLLLTIMWVRCLLLVWRVAPSFLQRSPWSPWSWVTAAVLVISSLRLCFAVVGAKSVGGDVLDWRAEHWCPALLYLWVAWPLCRPLCTGPWLPHW